MERIRSAIGEPAGVGAIERLTGAFVREDTGNLEAELADGRRVPVSRRRAQELRSLGL